MALARRNLSEVCKKKQEIKEEFSQHCSGTGHHNITSLAPRPKRSRGSLPHGLGVNRVGFWVWGLGFRALGFTAEKDQEMKY